MSFSIGSMGHGNWPLSTAPSNRTLPAVKSFAGNWPAMNVDTYQSQSNYFMQLAQQLAQSASEQAPGAFNYNEVREATGKSKEQQQKDSEARQFNKQLDRVLQDPKEGFGLKLTHEQLPKALTNWMADDDNTESLRKRVQRKRSGENEKGKSVAKPQPYQQQYDELLKDVKTHDLKEMKQLLQGKKLPSKKAKTLKSKLYTLAYLKQKMKQVRDKHKALCQSVQSIDTGYERAVKIAQKQKQSDQDYYAALGYTDNDEVEA